MRPVHAPLHAALALLCASAGDIESLTVPFSVTAARVRDIDGKTGDELVVVGRAGEIRVYGWNEDEGKLAPVGASEEFRLSDPGHSLLAFADVDADGRSELVVVDREGARRHALASEGGFDPEGVLMHGRARCSMRTGRPVFSNMVRDVNQDGLDDLIVPIRNGTNLWLAERKEPDGAVRLRYAASIYLKVAHSSSSGLNELSSEISESFWVPGLRTDDVNGDGREDLLVSAGKRRSFHLQREDGSFGKDPDVSVDLEIFRDTSPESQVLPGEVLAPDQDAQYTSADLTGDGIPDYVISHRRKVWVFHGGEAGPQFTDPAVILRVADDVTALIIAELNDDERPDLLLLKVEVPGISALLVGLFRDWDVKVRAVGYANDKGLFGRVPAHRRELTLRLPAILDLVRNPEEIVSKFRKVGKQFRLPTITDLDGDGRTDLALISESDDMLDIWRGLEGQGTWEPDENAVRDLLFEDEKTLWDIDRILRGLSNLASSRITELTEGRKPDKRLELRGEGFTLADFRAADLEGDGREEILVFYEENASGLLVIDVLRLGRD